MQNFIPTRLYLFNGGKSSFSDRRKFLKMILEPGTYEICYDQNHFIRIDHFKRLITYHIFDWIEKNDMMVANVKCDEKWWESSLKFTVVPKQEIKTIEELENSKKIDLPFEFRLYDSKTHIWKFNIVSDNTVKETINVKDPHQLRFHCHKPFFTKKTIEILIKILDSMNLNFDYCMDYDYYDEEDHGNEIVLKTIPKSMVRKLLDKI